VREPELLVLNIWSESNLGAEVELFDRCHESSEGAARSPSNSVGAGISPTDEGRSNGLMRRWVKLGL